MSGLVMARFDLTSEGAVVQKLDIQVRPTMMSKNLTEPSLTGYY